MLDAIKKALFGDPEPETQPQTPEEKVNSKQKATKNKEPWVDIVSVDIDPTNARSGAFELDWNEYFLTDLKKQGYPSGIPDQQLIDMWFQDVCKQIAMEEYERANTSELGVPRARVMPVDGERNEYS